MCFSIGCQCSTVAPTTSGAGSGQLQDKLWRPVLMRRERRTDDGRFEDGSSVSCQCCSSNRPRGDHKVSVRIFLCLREFSLFSLLHPLWTVAVHAAQGIDETSRVFGERHTECPRAQFVGPSERGKGVRPATSEAFDAHDAQRGVSICPRRSPSATLGGRSFGCWMRRFLS